MSSITLAVGRPTLADRIFTRTLALDIVLVVAGAALTAVAAQVAAPLWPVPITGQTLAVLLVGVTLAVYAHVLPGDDEDAEALEAGRFGKLILGTVRVRWCRDQAYYEFSLCRQLQVTGFPSVFIQTADLRFVMVARGYTDYETLKLRIENVLLETGS